VVSRGGATFITDFRYASQVKKEVTSMKCLITSPATKAIAKIINAGKSKVVGIEDKNLTVANLNELRKFIKAKFKPAHFIEELRLIKDQMEVKLIEKNFSILARVFKEIPEIIKPGMKETAVSAELEYRLKIAGGEGKAFDFIVASGKRSALPHGIASNKKIGKRDFITLDWGNLLGGYHTDNTRNFSIGKPSKKMREIFDIVQEANQKSIDAIKPGIPLANIDFAGRSYIESKGYGKFFGHGTGHGVGLDIHENPAVNKLSKMEAKEGMVFTIEPGIYLPGIGGVRIEDMVLVTKKGKKLLSKNLPPELIVL